MGKRGGKRGGGGRGRGGYSRNDGSGPRPDNRVDKNSIPRTNAKFENYYNELDVVPEEERDQFWDAMRRDLPNSFRFTGSKRHALAVQERLRNFYIPEISSIKYEGEFVETPKPVTWYPDQLAWYMTTPKHIIRRFKPFASFQKFLVAETDVGNITRQEVVSMIPPLVIDIKPGMTVLDLCAAPGSKSAQLLEMIHGGEEDCAREVALNLEKGLNIPEGKAYEDDGRSTGLLIANDVDYKRAHMLVHQMKRLASPNIIVTNHDATIFPSIKLPSDGTSSNRYLKFDRILADVPCSGDGTPRKNIEIWQKWTPSNGLGLHMTQVRILVRALQMLKTGGRVVYSTCSMNPVEDEAVLAAAIERSGSIIDIVETKDLLPGLKRYPGLKKWKIMDKAGRFWSDWESVEKHRSENGDDGLSRIHECMFPPKYDLPLDRAMRIYPHLHDTGAFFIAILEKRGETRHKSDDRLNANSEAKQAPAVSGSLDLTTEVEVADSTGTITKMATEETGTVTNIGNTADDLVEKMDESEEGYKRKRQEGEDSHATDPKRIKSIAEHPSTDTQSAETLMPISEAKKNSSELQKQTNGHVDGNPNGKKKNRDQPFEEPFKYLEPNIPELERITDFYKLSPRFPKTRFMVRNGQATANKNIYYTTQLAKDILQENEGKGMKFIHSGVKMFVKQDAPSPEVCPWRIQTDGLRLLETWVGKERIIVLYKKETLRKLLVEMFPRFAGDEWKNLGEIGEQVQNLTMGCCVLVVEPTETEGGFSERMVFPLWKSIQSLNLMLPKEERKAMLLRLFNDNTELVNPMGKRPHSKEDQNGGLDRVELKIEDSREEDEEINEGSVRRNSSSPEPESIALPNGRDKPEVASEDEDDGGVKIDPSEQTR